MMLDYHQLTMGEPANSPARRHQHAVIVAIMMAGLSYLVMTSGLTVPLEPAVGIFPGGSFCYKLAHRDYAASMGLGRHVMTDATATETSTKFTNVERKQVEHNVYHVFLDNPWEFQGRALRWATGMLVNDSQKDVTKKLMALNTSGKTKKREPTMAEIDELTAGEVMKMLPYQMTDFPSVSSLVLQFPHSHGFAAALVTNYKVIPQMRKLAKERGIADPVVIATCRKDEEMCTIYVPLAKTKNFLLGRPDSETYKTTLPDTPTLFSYRNFKQSIRKLVPFARDFVDKYMP